MKTVIRKWGNSNAVRLPKAILETANIGEKDTIRIIAAPNEIIIRKSVSAKKHVPLKERLKDFEGIYETEEAEMIPIGEEIFL
jgi:antitoxin MazE